MRPFFLVLVGACASVGTSLAVWVALGESRAVYYELVDNGLVRTNAGESLINTTVARVLEQHRSHIGPAEEWMARSDYRESADAWFAEPDLFGSKHERASRLVREQLDRDGHRVRVEVLRGTDMATLVFIEHEDREALQQIAEQIAGELADRGVQAR